MNRPRLFRRRSIWMPTLWGWLLLLLVASGSVLIVGVRILPFLAMNEPVAAGRARLLVVEGWMAPSEIEQAIPVIRAGHYERIVTTGGPIENASDFAPDLTWAERTASYLRMHGVPADQVVAINTPRSLQDRTFLGAVTVRDWTERSMPGLDALDVFSVGPHARRSHLLFQLAFGDGVAVGVIACRPASYDAEAWWKSSVGAESVLSETIKLAWTKLFFRPGPRGSSEERWAVPSSRKDGASRK
jgi:hypothetical protein